MTSKRVARVFQHQLSFLDILISYWLLSELWSTVVLFGLILRLLVLSSHPAVVDSLSSDWYNWQIFKWDARNLITSGIDFLECVRLITSYRGLRRVLLHPLAAVVWGGWLGWVYCGVWPWRPTYFDRLEKLSELVVECSTLWAFSQ